MIFLGGSEWHVGCSTSFTFPKSLLMETRPQGMGSEMAGGSVQPLLLVAVVVFPVMAPLVS